jgi:hypothetical protein
LYHQPQINPIGKEVKLNKGKLYHQPQINPIGVAQALTRSIASHRFGASQSTSRCSLVVLTTPAFAASKVHGGAVGLLLALPLIFFCMSGCPVEIGCRVDYTITEGL